MADAADESVLLQQCPFCDYTLRGLPVEHRCPECGEEIDRRSTVFGARFPWSSRTMRGRIANVTILVAGVIILLNLVSNIRTNHWILISILCAILLAMTLVVSVLNEVRKPAVFIAVGPIGVLLCNHRTKHRRLYEWSRVDDVSYRGWGYLDLMIDGKWLTIGRWPQARGAPSKWEDHIRKLRERYV
jgi:predicted RNA-binding Zn-ribbon protein involved in translation (DUF1610 family)